jgi:hypothetical protein
MSDFIDHGLLLVVYTLPERRTEAPRHFLALGVAPDWARAARLNVGGRVRTVAVRGNAYVLRGDAPIRFERLER